MGQQILPGTGFDWKSMQKWNNWWLQVRHVLVFGNMVNPMAPLTKMMVYKPSEVEVLYGFILTWVYHALTTGNTMSEWLSWIYPTVSKIWPMTPMTPMCQWFHRYISMAHQFGIDFKGLPAANSIMRCHIDIQLKDDTSVLVKKCEKWGWFLAICNPWCWNMLTNICPNVQNHRQFCRFLYTSTMRCIWDIDRSSYTIVIIINQLS